MTVPVDATLEAVLRRDRLVVVTALTAGIALSWAYLLVGAGMGMSAFEMTRVSQLGIAKGMFEGDMAGMAMMTPAALPGGRYRGIQCPDSVRPKDASHPPRSGHSGGACNSCPRTSLLPIFPTAHDGEYRRQG